MTESNTKRRGFASMGREKLKAIASLGGKTAHAMGVAHQFTSEEAVIAGRKGGRAKQTRKDVETSVAIAGE
jgi:general stress protein YciG